ncbi:MAG: thioredoxin domain-containing protein [Bacteroidales bacterium]|nr:thioredoxin domain-containing protein [Bacteroidales bacterium]
MSTKNSSHYTNRLINETSPYLLQHARNPVDWHPWGDEALDKAEEEDKPLIISIGYSSCHWCHVMADESFGDESIAQLMNDHFIPVKVDREEHPDVDQTYMTAVQLLSGRGGWPLNVFALPDGRPFWGGTYFNKEQWTAIVEKISDLYKNKYEDLEAQAEQLESGIRRSSIIQPVEEEQEFTFELAKTMSDKLSRDFDYDHGGMAGSPKFPLPVIPEFLLQYNYHQNNSDINRFIQTTLRNMAYGGIYDQIGGGFSRYATDDAWRIPHFEKMLYDNAQLVSLYSKAYQYFKEPLYEEVVRETITFLKREMMSEENGFYSALDADSEGVEGKYYVWTKNEIERILNDYSSLFCDYYNVEGLGYWENGKNVLMRSTNDETFAKRNNLSLTEWTALRKRLKQDMFNARNNRKRPGLDDKILTSWNGLMLNGLVDAYKAFGKEEYLSLAQKSARFIMNHLLGEKGGLFHTYKNGQAKINGFLEDYAFVIEAFINLYQVTLEKAWVDKAHDLMDYAIKHFFDRYAGLFFYTSDEDKQVVSRRFETMDNVIPASNSSMVRSLFYLGHFYEYNDYRHKAKAALMNVMDRMQHYPSAFANWGRLLLHFTTGFNTVAIAGHEALTRSKELQKYFHPEKIVLGHASEAVLPHLENRFVDGKTMIYVCTEKACQQPVETIEDALQQLKA